MQLDSRAGSAYAWNMIHRKRAKTLSTALESYLAGLDTDLPFRLVRLWRNWDQVVGEEVAGLGKPLGHRDRILRIGTEDHAAQQELVYWGPVILAAVHAFLGEECFDKVQVDLLMGRAPLDSVGIESPRAEASAGPLIRPEKLGGLLGRMRPDSPVARCYMAYVRRFGETDPPGQEDS